MPFESLPRIFTCHLSFDCLHSTPGWEQVHFTGTETDGCGHVLEFTQLTHQHCGSCPEFCPMCCDCGSLTGFPDDSLGTWLSDKGSTTNASGDAGNLGLIPGWGRCPGEGNGSPFQYSHLEKSHGQRSLVGCSRWVTQGWTWLSNWAHTHGSFRPRNWEKGWRLKSQPTYLTSDLGRLIA